MYIRKYSLIQSKKNAGIKKQSFCFPYFVFDSDTAPLSTIYGFFDSSLEYQKNSKQNECEITRILNANDFFCLTQTHSSSFVVIDTGDKLQNKYMEADALIVDKRFRENIVYAVFTADCLPVIVETEQFFALIHAGWRGLASTIIDTTADFLLQKNQKIQKAIIGPSICPKHYEVQNETLLKIKNPVFIEDKIREKVSAQQSPIRGSREGEKRSLLEVNEHFRPTDNKVDGAVEHLQEKFFLDLAGTAAKHLLRNGCLELFIADVCTFEDQRFYSHRRQGTQRGVNVNFIVY
jgi:YfiH family protein